jgi:sodium-dependent dicarboxylate transporter 2/3/5
MMPKLLLVDDNDGFRSTLAKRLRLRGYEVLDTGTGEEAIRVARNDLEIEVIVLDLKMPGMSGDEVLREIRVFRPAVQVIMLTGFGSIESAMLSAKLDAFAYLAKPCDFDELVSKIEAAREAKVHAMTRHEVPHVIKGSIWKWLLGSPNHRPGVIIVGLLIFFTLALAPPPHRLLELVSVSKEGEASDQNLGYAHYSSLQAGESIADYYGRTYKLTKLKQRQSGSGSYGGLMPEQAAFRAKVMLAILVVAALFWATGAVPIGITALFVGVAIYFFGVLGPDDAAKAFAKDAVVFIFGVLAISQAISKTGLDRRIGLLLLGSARTLPRLLFFFIPMFAVACSFVSEHALIAFVMPLLMVVYDVSLRQAGIKQDKALAVMLGLSLCYAGNSGGPGSPAAGGRNAIMLGILSDYNAPLSFADWVAYGLPFVPVMALVTTLYFFLVFRKRLKVNRLDAASIIRQSAEKIGPMNVKEYKTAVVLVLLIILWIAFSSELGMGGPAILAIVALNVLKVLRWKDIASISWDVVFLYASAAALGKGLAVTGAALYLADGFISLLPGSMRSGEGLAIAVSLFTGLATNFMSDGATVSAIGPIAVPMATLSETPPWMIGLATAFASSFAHVLVIGTPNNAIVYALAKDPITGEQLLTLGDFLKHGTVILLLSFAVLWFWAILGYWRLVGF